MQFHSGSQSLQQSIYMQHVQTWKREAENWRSLSGETSETQKSPVAPETQTLYIYKRGGLF